MEVVLVATEGRAREALIEIDGRRLRVVDGFSRVGEPLPPGRIESPKFAAVVKAPQSWDLAVAANPDWERRLEPRWGWRYLGYAEVVALEPLRVDLGSLLLELDLEVDGPERLGAFVTLEIDRITLLRGA
jgi:hypothetical protein